MSTIWRKRGQMTKQDKEHSASVQKREIIRWLKRGFYEVNLKLVDEGTSISFRRFWKLVHENIHQRGK